MVMHSKSKVRASVTGEWECDECGYYRRGTLRNRPKRCPECGAPADSFSFWADDEEEDSWDDEYYDDDDWEY